MRKKIFAAVLLAAAVCFAACAPAETPPAPKQSVQADAAAGQRQPQQKILIAYFSRADNTTVADPNAVDTDAVTGASLLPPGNAAVLAGIIHDEIGGDLLSIHVSEPYPEDYEQCLDRAVYESTHGLRPELSTYVGNMDEYDIIFIGYPNWDYGAPMAVLSFLEGYDLSGKTIIPFCTHGTGGLSSSVRQITQSARGAEVVSPIGIFRSDMEQAPQKLKDWLQTLPLAPVRH